MDNKNHLGKLYEEHILSVEKGKTIVEKYVKRNVQQVSLVFPDNDKELLTAVLKRISVLKKNYQFIQFFSTEEINEISQYTDIDYSVTILTKEEMDGVVRYASMIGLSSLKIISLIQPSSQKAKQLIGYKDIDLDKIVLRCLLGVMEGE